MPKRQSVNLRMRPDVLEALDELADEIVVSRSRLVEIAVERFLLDLDLPSTSGAVDQVPA